MLRYLVAGALAVAGMLVGPPAHADDGVWYAPDPNTANVKTFDGVERIVLDPVYAPAGTTTVSLADWSIGFDPAKFALKIREGVYTTGQDLLGAYIQVVGGNTPDVIEYTNHDDVAGIQSNCSNPNASLGSPVTIRTLAGDDTLLCLLGTLDAGTGNDTMYGFPIADAQTVELGEGDDVAFVDEALQTFGGGESVLAAVAGDHDVVAAGAGDDTVYASSDDAVTDAEHVLRPQVTPAPVAKPGQPKHVITKRVTRTRAWVQWACAPRATSYRVRVGTRTFVTTGMRLNVRGLHRGRAYNVVVRGHNASGWGVASRVARIGARVR